MPFDLPPIAKSAEHLMVEVEKAVRGFSRYHKYTTGTDLRDQTKRVVTLVNRAWRDRSRQLQWIEELTWAIDELRLSMQIGSRLQAFRSFRQFEMLIRLVDALGKQAGGWKRQQQQHRKGQNPTRNAAPERAQILSASATPVGVNT